MADSVCDTWVSVFSHIIETFAVVDFLLCTFSDSCHHLNSFYRISTCCCLTRKHSSTCSIVDSVSYVSSLGTSRTRVLHHGIEHLCSCDNYFTCCDYFFDNHLLDDWNFFFRDFYTHVTTLLTNTLKRMSDTIDQMGIMKPFSFVLEDDDRNTVADLYLADDDTVIIGDDLMKDLDSDLDSFFDNLMKE